MLDTIPASSFIRNLIKDFLENYPDLERGERATFLKDSKETFEKFMAWHEERGSFDFEVE